MFEHRPDKIKLQGFNNLTKCLSFNLYDFCIVLNDVEKTEYIEYIYSQYSADKVTELLEKIASIIDAKVLDISKQDYEPYGASSIILMSDIQSENMNHVGFGSQSVLHLDKSHITAHTYPDIDEASGICTFRIDIDISTCGEISPLSALNFMLKSYYSDVVIIDYVVRGFTRDENGKRVYMDHIVYSIQDYIEKPILNDYFCLDIVNQHSNIWQTKMLRQNINDNEYFNKNSTLSEKERIELMPSIKREMIGLFYGWRE